MNLPCPHKQVTFLGKASLVGNYYCDVCGEKIDPIEYAKMNGDLNIALLDYYTKNPNKLNPSWRNHPWVKHLYELPT